MRVGIITHYDVHNHGAILQLNALVRVLRHYGHTACALQFEKNYDFLGIEYKDKYNISFRSLPIYVNYLLQKGLKRTYYNIKKRKILEDFKKNNLLIGGYYSKTETDAVIVGSDEVFALHTGPTPVFFGHALHCKKIIAYAASFGPTTFNDIVSKGCLALVRSGMENMSALSVRDKNSFEILQSLTGKSAMMVCDPVILYGYEEELKNMSPVKLPPYLLIYAYDNNMNDPAEVERIKKYAETRKLKIVSAGFYHRWCDYNINADLIELLNYFKYAKGVITDTFHGSVLSIITNVEFAVIMRNNANKLNNLLEEYSLTERISKELVFERVFEKVIDYSIINEELKKRRKESLTFLLNALS